MNRSVSVSELCNRSANLHLCGYSEEVLDNLIQCGDLQGHFNADRGEMMVDTTAVLDFLPFDEESQAIWSREQSERAKDYSNSEGML